MLVGHGRKGEKKGFRERDLAGMVDAAHQQLGRARIVLVWDNDTCHRDAERNVSRFSRQVTRGFIESIGGSCRCRFRLVC
jgi:hypothetical protein